VCTSAHHHKVCTALQDGLMTPASERADLQCKLIPAVLSEVQHIHAPRAFSCLLVYSILVEMLNCCCMIRPDTICALRAYQRQGCVEPYGFAHQHASTDCQLTQTTTQAWRHAQTYSCVHACMKRKLREGVLNMVAAASSCQLNGIIQKTSAWGCCTPGAVHCSACT